MKQVVGIDTLGVYTPSILTSFLYCFKSVVWALDFVALF